MNTKTIGIIGGMGPYAALDVARKLHEQSRAKRDREHPNTVVLSFCQEIPDRTEFLIGQTQENPGLVLAHKLQPYPLDLIGIACNTFHAPEIFQAFRAALTGDTSKPEIISLPLAVREELMQHYPGARVGLLSTLGTFKAGIYQAALEGSGIELVCLEEPDREALHEVMYHPDWGIKQKGQLSPQAKRAIEQLLPRLKEADALLLACTELPLVMDELDSPLPLIDINLILARALLTAAGLKPL